MAKQNPFVRLRTYGIYSLWQSDDKELPAFVEQTNRICAKVDVEFGLVVNIVGGKNLPMDYCIDHPGILDDAGKRRAPFTGTVFVKSNDWDFYLGDTIWLPIEDKLGIWRMTLELAGEVIADQSFELYRRVRSEREIRYQSVRMRIP